MEGTWSYLVDHICSWKIELIGYCQLPCGAAWHTYLSERGGAPSVHFVASRNGERVVQAKVYMLDRCINKVVDVGWDFLVDTYLLRETQLIVITASPNIEISIFCDTG